MNKKVSAFIAIALAAGTMVGCSSKSSTSASGAEGKVINIYSWNDEFRQRVEAVYPEVKSTSKDGTVTKLKDGSEIKMVFTNKNWMKHLKNKTQLLLMIRLISSCQKLTT